MLILPNNSTEYSAQNLNLIPKSQKKKTYTPAYPYGTPCRRHMYDNRLNQFTSNINQYINF